jgi:hypothetical protein
MPQIAVGFRARGFEAKVLPDAIEALVGIPLGDKNRPQLIHHSVILRQRLE